MRTRLFLGAFVAAVSLVRAESLDLTRATIAEINAAFTQGTLTSEKLTAFYLARIAAYDKQGPTINAVITLNPQALELARALDAERKAKGPRSPLHGIPVLLKDNFDTVDLPTTGGSQLLKDSLPPDDAFVVKKLRDAGAIILAKLNMSEFATGGGAPNGFSSMGGQTRNPHDLTKGPAGSSGGTGAAIAAAFGQVGLGSDTGGSIRGPSAANGTAGLKPTRGLMSRDGIIPLALSLDTGGPMARSVYDVAAALGVMTGVDPADAATKTSAGKFHTDYTQFLKRGALKGARIGVARDFFGQNEETDRIIEAAVAKLRELGATTIDVKFPTFFTQGRRGLSTMGTEFKAQIATYLSTLKPGYPRTLAEVVARAEDPKTGYTSPWKRDSMKRTLETALEIDDPTYLAAVNEGYAFVRATVLAVMAKDQLDALVYPTSPTPAREIGTGTLGGRGSEGGSAPGSPGGPNSPSSIANQTGFPDLIVPAGMTKDGLPVTLSFFGRAYSEPKLFGYGYDFEQATLARVLPKTTPPLSAPLAASQ